MRRLVRYKPSRLQITAFFVGATNVRKDDDDDEEEDDGCDAEKRAGEREKGRKEKKRNRERARKKGGWTGEAVDLTNGREHSVKLSPHPSPRQ